MKATLKMAVVAVLAAGCAGGGADLGSGASAVVAPCPAPVFEAGLCVCEDFSDRGFGLVASKEGGAAARVGVNGKASFQGHVEIAGDVDAHGGLDSRGAFWVQGTARTAGDMTSWGNTRVAKDLWVGGDLATRHLEVGGSLNVGGSFSAPGNPRVGATGDYQAPDALPCNCDPATFFDVAAAVAASKAANDNAAAGLDASGVGGKVDLELATGRYYFSDFELLRRSEVRVAGNVAVFVDGSLRTQGRARIVVADGASLDLYVAGDVDTLGNLGVEAAPGQARIYVGGEAPMVATWGHTDIAASLYAPRAEVLMHGHTRLVGSLFARKLTIQGHLELFQAAPVLPADVCQPVDECVGELCQTTPETTCEPEAPGCGLPNESPCASDADCEFGSCDAEAGTCVPTPIDPPEAGAGVSCVDDSACLSSACVQGACAPGVAGTACRVGADCEAGLACSSGTCTSPIN